MRVDRTVCALPVRRGQLRRSGCSISVIAGLCNHRNRVGNLKTRGPVAGAFGLADQIAKALRNFQNGRPGGVLAVYRAILFDRDCVKR